MSHPGSTTTDPQPDRKPPTIYDVAARAGVSAATVSRVFSRPGRVSSRTAQQVRAVAEELGYRADNVYRAPTPARTRMIGIALSDITNPVFFPIIRGATHAAQAQGYTLVIGDAQENDRLEREMFTRVLPVVDGLVVASSRVSDTDLRALAKQIPVVVLNRDVRGIPSVVPDTARGVRRAVEHLATLGHRRICYVAGPSASYADGTRWRALREACMELELSEVRIGPYPPTTKGGMEAAVEVKRRGVGAVVVYNDLMAIGLMRGLQRLGTPIPQEVSVIGFDNIFASDLVSPGLTTVAAPLLALGETAAHNVIALAAGAHGTQQGPTVVPTKLVVRESTAPPA